MPTLFANSSHHYRDLLQPSREKRVIASAVGNNASNSNSISAAGSKNTSSSTSQTRRNSGPLKSPLLTDPSATTSSNAAITKSARPGTSEKSTSVTQKRAAATPVYIRSHRRLPSSTPTNSRPPTADPSAHAKSPTTVTTRPPTAQSNTLASPQSPQTLKRKAPARFSSNGVATSSGPPPSLAFRRTNPTDQRVAGAFANGISSLVNRANNPVIPTIRGGGGKQQTQETAAEVEARRNSIQEEAEEANEEKDEDDTIRGLENIKREIPVAEKDEDTAMADNESGKDVFLNLARSNPSTRPILLNSKALPSELRWSRLASQNRSSLPPNAYSASPRPQSRRASELRSRATARLSVPPMVDALAEALTSPSREASPRPAGAVKREESGSIAASDNARAASTLSTHVAVPREPQLSPVQDRSIATMIEKDRAERKRETDANSQAAETASTASTTAPSVWDEVDDIKSRIRRLELSTKFLTPGNGATSSEGRPRTATTTATTLSSSPKHPVAPPAASPAASSVAQNINSHPLLHAALIKSQSHVSPEVYKCLEAAAKDALSLSTMVGGPATSLPPVAGQSATERQLRRKVDSLCRCVTELCIALSEPRTNTTTANGTHSSLSNHDLSSSFSRSRPPTQDSEGRGSLTRAEARSHFLEQVSRGGSGRDSVMSERSSLPRLENSTGTRRGSLAQLGHPTLATLGLVQSQSQPSLNERRPSVTTTEMLPPSSSSAPASKLARASMLLKARREASASAAATGRISARDDLMEDIDMHSVDGLRVPSRAATDVFSRGHQHLREIEEVRRPSLLGKREYSSSSTTTVTNANLNMQRRSPLYHLQSEASSSLGVASNGIVNSTRRRLLTRSMVESTASLASPTTASVIGRRYLDDYPQEMELDVYPSSAERFRRGGSFLSAAEKKKKTLSVPGANSRLGHEYGIEDKEFGISAREGGRFLRRRVE